jgi:hypothetical protein
VSFLPDPDWNVPYVPPPIVQYIAFRASDAFFAAHARYPGSLPGSQSLEEDTAAVEAFAESLLVSKGWTKDQEGLPKAVKDAVGEMCARSFSALAASVRSYLALPSFLPLPWFLFFQHPCRRFGPAHDGRLPWRRRRPGGHQAPHPAVHSSQQHGCDRSDPVRPIGLFLRSPPLLPFANLSLPSPWLHMSSVLRSPTDPVLLSFPFWSIQLGAPPEPTSSDPFLALFLFAPVFDL